MRPGREHTVAASVTIAAPIEDVWELATDPARFADWNELTLEVTRADSPLGMGSTYEERNRVLGPLTGHSRWTVVEHDPPRRCGHRGEGLPLVDSLHVVTELRPVEAATELTIAIRYRPRLGPLGALVDRLFARRSLAGALERSVRELASLPER